MAQLDRVRNIAAALVAATIVAAGPAIAAPVLKPPAQKRHLEVTLVDDDANAVRATDIYDQDYEASEAVEHRAAASAEARLALTRPAPDCTPAESFPEHLEWSRIDDGFVIDTGRGVHKMSFDGSPASADLINARLRQLVHPGFTERHYAC